MADILATANGNFSNPATWVGGVVPGPSDNAYANNRTVVLDADVTVTKLSNKAEAGAVFGGEFTISGSRTINATVEGGGGGGSCISMTTNSPSIVTINGNVQGVTLATGFSGTLNVVGNVSNNNVSSGYGIWSMSGTTGSINVTGNITGKTGGSGTQLGMYLQGTQTVVVNGNLIAESSRTVINSTANSNMSVTGTTHTVDTSGSLFSLTVGSSTLTLNGNVSLNTTSNEWGTLGGTSSGIINLSAITYLNPNPSHIRTYNSASLVVNGDVSWPNLGTSMTSPLFWVQGSSSLVINGNVTSINGSHSLIHTQDSGSVTINGNLSGNGSYSDGTISLYGGSNNLIQVNGTVTGGDKGPAINEYFSSASGTVRCDKVVGNGYGPGAPVTISKISTISFTNVSSKIITKQLQYGSRGNPPTESPTFIDQDPANTIELELEDNVTNVVFVPGLVSQDYPTPGEVLNGVSYGFGAFTGTMIQYNVVDTATLITEMKTEGISTVESVGAQLATFGT